MDDETMLDSDRRPCEPDGRPGWLLLIYTVPRAPSRKRAHVWRELKKLGGVYLRDGVCVVPARPETAAAMQRVAHTIRAFEGQATLVEAAELDPDTVARIVADAAAARAAEYAELAGEMEGFLAHVRREHEHRELRFAELEELEADLDKLRRWFAQIHARDYFPNPTDHERATVLLDRCTEALAGFLDDVYEQAEEPR